MVIRTLQAAKGFTRVGQGSALPRDDTPLALSAAAVAAVHTAIVASPFLPKDALASAATVLCSIAAGPEASGRLDAGVLEAAGVALARSVPSSCRTLLAVEPPSPSLGNRVRCSLLVCSRSVDDRSSETSFTAASTAASSPGATAAAALSADDADAVVAAATAAAAPAETRRRNSAMAAMTGGRAVSGSVTAASGGGGSASAVRADAEDALRDEPREVEEEVEEEDEEGGVASNTEASPTRATVSATR